jgi:hypothetical protein
VAGALIPEGRDSVGICAKRNRNALSRRKQVGCETERTAFHALEQEARSLSHKSLPADRPNLEHGVNLDSDSGQLVRSVQRGQELSQIKEGHEGCYRPGGRA